MTWASYDAGTCGHHMGNSLCLVLTLAASLQEGNVTADSVILSGITEGLWPWWSCCNLIVRFDWTRKPGPGAQGAEERGGTELVDITWMPPPDEPSASRPRVPRLPPKLTHPKTPLAVTMSSFPLGLSGLHLPALHQSLSKPPFRAPGGQRLCPKGGQLAVFTSAASRALRLD